MVLCKIEFYVLLCLLVVATTYERSQGGVNRRSSVDKSRMLSKSNRSSTIHTLIAKRKLVENSSTKSITNQSLKNAKSKKTPELPKKEVLKLVPKVPSKKQDVKKVEIKQSVNKGGTALTLSPLNEKISQSTLNVNKMSKGGSSLAHKIDEKSQSLFLSHSTNVELKSKEASKLTLPTKDQSIDLIKRDKSKGGSTLTNIKKQSDQALHQNVTNNASKENSPIITINSPGKIIHKQDGTKGGSSITLHAEPFKELSPSKSLSSDAPKFKTEKSTQITQVKPIEHPGKKEILVNNKNLAKTTLEDLNKKDESIKQHESIKQQQSKSDMPRVGHYEKVQRDHSQYFYVNDNKPNGIPGAFIISTKEAFSLPNEEKKKEALPTKEENILDEIKAIAKEEETSNELQVETSNTIPKEENNTNTKDLSTIKDILINVTKSLHNEPIANVTLSTSNRIQESQNIRHVIYPSHQKKYYDVNANAKKIFEAWVIIMIVIMFIVFMNMKP